MENLDLKKKKEFKKRCWNPKSETHSVTKRRNHTITNLSKFSLYTEFRNKFYICIALIFIFGGEFKRDTYITLL